MQKQVKINGLTVNEAFGILEVCELIYDPKINMYVTKGPSGHGKTTITTALQLATQGGNALVDNQKYGKVDLEVQLTDGDMSLWVGCKSKGKTLSYVLYTKDDNGKKITNPVIDGIEATPASYLQHLQTELTWKMDELCSENPSVQKKILLKLYQSQLQKIGVIFDKKHLDYGKSILGLIDAAVSHRDQMDFERKRLGGIADDLKAEGFDPDRPATCPDEIKIDEIDEKIKAFEKEKYAITSSPEMKKDLELEKIKSEAKDLTALCTKWNSDLKENFENETNLYIDYDVDVQHIKENVLGLKLYLEKLDLESEFEALEKLVKYPDKFDEPTEPIYINFDEKNNVIATKDVAAGGQTLIDQIFEMRKEYHKVLNTTFSANTDQIDEKIVLLEENKKDALEQNKIVYAIDSFHKWRESNEDVVRLKNDYVQLLAKVDTGVDGLEIQPIDDQIFLMYDGSYDVGYFNPKDKKKEMRKLSSYSGTQKPVICLLIQNFLLSKKAKAMRYLHIDNVPIDNTAKALIEKISKELNVHIFLNITGDFDKKALKAGEVLVEGGEVFF